MGEYGALRGFSSVIVSIPDPNIKNVNDHLFSMNLDLAGGSKEIIYPGKVILSYDGEKGISKEELYRLKSKFISPEYRMVDSKYKYVKGIDVGVVTKESMASLDQELMSGFYETNGLIQEAQLELEKDEDLELHIFIDKSVLEIFVNDKLCLTHRIYPTRDDSQGIVLFTNGGEIRVPELNAWKLHPSNPW